MVKRIKTRFKVYDSKGKYWKTTTMPGSDAGSKAYFKRIGLKSVPVKKRR